MRRRPLIAGLLLAALYVLSAAVSGRLDIFARRPLLDGVTPPPPYRWVKPPPELAERNLKPDSVTQNVKFTAGSSDGEFVATGDGQASIVLPKGAVPPRPGATAATFTIHPRDPAGFRGYPDGLRVRGNVYELRATYVGGAGGPVTALNPPGRAIFTYPAETGAFLHAARRVIFSPDGSSWRALETDNDSAVALQIAVSATEPGFFAVAAKPGAGANKGGSPAAFVVVGAVVAVAGLAGTYAWRTAQSRKRAARKKIPRQLPKRGGRKRR